MPLDTLANVKLHLGIFGSSDDAVLAAIQPAADNVIVTHTGRDFVADAYTEYHPGGGRLAFLKHYPVLAVTAVAVDADRQYPAASVRDAASYIVHPDRGVVENRVGPFLFGGASDAYPRAVKVDYTTPGPVPEAVRRAYAELIGHWFRQAKTHGEKGHFDLLQVTASGAVTQYPWGLSGGFRVPAGVLQLLQPFRLPAV